MPKYNPFDTTKHTTKHTRRQLMQKPVTLQLVGWISDPGTGPIPVLGSLLWSWKLITLPGDLIKNNMTVRSACNEVSHAKDMHLVSHLPASTEGSGTVSEPPSRSRKSMLQPVTALIVIGALLVKSRLTNSRTFRATIKSRGFLSDS